MLTGLSSRWQRAAAVVAVLLLCTVVGSTTVSGAQVSPGQSGRVPSESGGLSDQVVVPAEVPVSEADAATRVREVEAERTVFNRVWERSDGSRDAELSAVPVAFRAKDGTMQLIDSTVHRSAGADGWLVSGANDWSASFGPSDVGVQITTQTGSVIGSRPSAFGGTPVERVVAPVIDDADASVVWYRDVWPGVDLRYTVNSYSVKEDVVLARRALGPATAEFVVTGAELDAVWNVPTGEPPKDGPTVPPAPAEDLVLSSLARPERAPENASGASLIARGDLGNQVRFGTVRVDTAVQGNESDLPVTAGAVPLVRSAVEGPGLSRVEVSVSDEWMAGLPDEAFPVVIDPSVWLTSTMWGSFRSGGDWYSCGSTNFSWNPCAVYTSWDPWNWPGYWRGYANFDFSAMMGQEIQTAYLNIWLDGGTTTPCWVTTHVAAGLNYWDVAPPNSALGSVAMGSGAIVDIRGWLQTWAWNNANPPIGFSGHEAGSSGCFKALGASVTVTYRPWELETWHWNIMGTCAQVGGRRGNCGGLGTSNNGGVETPNSMVPSRRPENQLIAGVVGAAPAMRPWIITLNEVCSRQANIIADNLAPFGYVARFAKSQGNDWNSRWESLQFWAPNGREFSPVNCGNPAPDTDDFGNMVLMRGSAHGWSFPPTIHYQSQLPDETGSNNYVCINVVTHASNRMGCATHLQGGHEADEVAAREGQDAEAFLYSHAFVTQGHRLTVGADRNRPEWGNWPQTFNEVDQLATVATRQKTYPARPAPEKKLDWIFSGPNYWVLPIGDQYCPDAPSDPEGPWTSDHCLLRGKYAVVG